MTQDELKKRSKQFALRMMSMVSTLPSSREADVIARQILRSATSVGANYRAACRARSKADFISKITIVEEEADETLFWMELIAERDLIKSDCLSELMKEGNELVAIFTAAGKTAKLHQRNNPQSTIHNPK